MYFFSSVLNVQPLISPALLCVLVSWDGASSHAQITFFPAVLLAAQQPFHRNSAQWQEKGSAGVRLARVPESHWPRESHFAHTSVHAYEEMLQSPLTMISCYFLFICVSVEHIKISQ